MIRFNNVSFSYRDHKVFEDLSFTLDTFTSAALLGLNGEGKTTFIKLLLGLLKPDEGTIFIDESDINTLNEENRSLLLSYVPQQTDDTLSMSVLDFVCMGKISQRDFFKGPDDTEKETALSLLKTFECDEFSQRDISTLSSGQRRMIYLIRAIYQDSRIYIMDEPISSLDFLKQHELLHQLKDHLLKHDKQLIFSIHDPCLAYEYADTFIFFKDHQLYDVIKKTDDDFSKTFTTDVSALYDDKVSIRFIEGKMYMQLS